MKGSFALTLLLASGLVVAAQDAPAPSGATPAKRCLNLIQIENTEIIDNKHIVFHLIGKDMYLNTLDHACAGLSERDPFLYKTHVDQLCDLDVITVLHPVGMGFIPGPSCGLGKFEKVTKEQVDMLKRAESHQ